MKRYLLVGLITVVSLTGCVTNRNPNVNTDLTQENWRRQVDTVPQTWVRGADSWFLTGDPNSAEVANGQAPTSAAISTMQVQVPVFNYIKVDGAFQVQLFGTDENNTVYLYGPNAAIREIAVEVNRNTLYIHQTQNVPRTMKQVIVRIGVRDLNRLTQAGCGSIEAVRLNSTNLCINTTATSSGNIYLSGNMNLTRVMHAGTGSVTVLGATTQQLAIKTSGNKGCVNVSGNVGICSIIHRGRNDISIVGANSDGVTVDASGSGKISLQGDVNIKKIQARDRTCVYAYTSHSTGIYANAYNYARIGISGSTTDLSVDTQGSARFEGRYLCAQDAYVRASDWSHINVTATNKIFASATNNSSVYFFGAPNLMSQFVSGNGVVIPIWNGAGNSCLARPSYKDETNYSYKGEVAPRYHWVNRRLVGS